MCVCVCMYVCICMCTCVYVCVCMFVYMCVCVLETESTEEAKPSVKKVKLEPVHLKDFERQQLLQKGR